jgi:hypothetical protein
MFDNKYILIYQANGKLDAELIKAFLEAADIPVELIQESAGSTLGLTIGSLGLVDVMVQAEKADEARLRLDEMEKGKFDKGMNSDYEDDC